MKFNVTMIAAALMLASPAAFGDAAAIYTKSCASCHGKDGSGDTKMGKKSGARDYRDAKVQASFSDADAVKAILEGVKEGGKTKMKAFAGKVSEADAKELVKHIRGFKK